MKRPGEGPGGPAGPPREALELAHHHPGRLRVRADALVGAEDVAQAVRESLDAVPGIVSVKYTAQTGSFLVEYEPGHADADEIILRIAEAADLDPPLDEAALRERRARPALLAIGATKEINRLAEEVTGGRTDLRTLVPAAMAGLAVYSFLEEKQRMPRWDNLLYWSFNIFTTLHRREIETNGTESARPRPRPAE